jgi:hypothetical protein
VADFHEDALVAGAFAAFRSDVAPYVRPAGTAAAHETVRHRRRVRAVAATTLAVLVIGAPVVAYAAINGDPHGPPVVPASGGPSPEPSQTSASPSSTSSPVPSAPDGRIARADLDGATLTVSNWGPDAPRNPDCPTGPLRFTGGTHHAPGLADVAILDVAYADVNHDGAQETLAWLVCDGQGVNSYQVMAFDRDTTGTITALGQVAADTSTVKGICGVRAGADGASVDVQVVDFTPGYGCQDRQNSPAQFQWRTYNFDGTRFTQVGGPTSFPVNPKVSDLTVTTTDLTFGPQAADGHRDGSMTVTVRNIGKSAMPYTLNFQLQSGLIVVGPAGCRVTVGDPTQTIVACQYGPLAAGSTQIITLQLRAPAMWGTAFTPNVTAVPQPGYGDWNPADNRAEFKITSVNS